MFETLLTADDAIISDQLNHASIIDGVRLCKAQRYRFKNSDMADLEEKLKDTGKQFPEEFKKYMKAGIKILEAESTAQAKKKASHIYTYFDEKGQYHIL